MGVSGESQGHMSHVLEMKTKGEYDSDKCPVKGKSDKQVSAQLRWGQQVTVR